MMFNESTMFSSIFLVLIGGMNLFTFILFYIDKQRAIKRKYRISERALLLTSFSMGGIGGWLGMKHFRHKTRHSLFKYSLPVAAILTVVVSVFLIQSLI
ncbi:MAG: DUF1294 domain-containing protein [Alkalibacterium sp.]|nr:DUF1294 domain-containing protein [Alkalibacterium sp.]